MKTRKTKFLYLLTFSQAVLILTLIPFARRLEQLGSSVVHAAPILIASTIFLVGFIGVFLLYLYVRELRRSLTPLNLGRHLSLLLCTCLAALFQLHLPIELSHIILYGMFAASLRIATISANPAASALPVVIAGTGLGIADELLQWLHPERVFDLRDISLNATATCLGLFIALPLSGDRKRFSAQELSTCTT